ncbi:MAG: MFS transporter [Myxococcales bacterium]|nr:MAG: MFS transporter [Myxococcales bacterium]
MNRLGTRVNAKNMNMPTAKNHSKSDHKNIQGIAWMSFFWSMSTLMVFSLLPAFLVDELKTGHHDIGLIEGIAISSSFLAKFFSGFLSDVMRKRKPLILLGAALTAMVKPIFALSTTTGMVFGLRFIDRLSKGIRSAPTDALIADLSERGFYATNFGFREALYTLGQVVGALAAMLLMLSSNNNYRLVFALSAIPASLALLILFLWIKPNPNSHPRADTRYHRKKVELTDIKEFSPIFWWLMLAFFFLMLGRFSEAFLTLKAKEVGWSVAYLPMMIIVMDLVHAGVAIPCGKYADKISRSMMLSAGLVLMFTAQAFLSYVSSIAGTIIGVILVGLHMGATQGLLKAMIAQATPAKLRGTAYSLFFVISGVALFLANTIAGNLSHRFGLSATFLMGSFFSIFAAGVIYIASLRRPAIKSM